MKKLNKPQFILIISCLNKVDNQEIISSSAILFKSFKEALKYARDDAETYKHLVSTYVEHIGDNKLHADIHMHGKYINKSYRVSDMNYSSIHQNEQIRNHITTYCSLDYYNGGMLF